MGDLPKDDGRLPYLVGRKIGADGAQLMSDKLQFVDADRIELFEGSATN
jgi:hypothetical protein